VYNRHQSAFGLVYLRLLGVSTVMFCYYLLGGNTVVPSGLYVRLCHAFLVRAIKIMTHANYLASVKIAKQPASVPFYVPIGCQTGNVVKCKRNFRSANLQKKTNNMLSNHNRLSIINKATIYNRVRTVHKKTNRTQYPILRPQFRPTQGPIRVARLAHIF